MDLEIYHPIVDSDRWHFDITEDISTLWIEQDLAIIVKASISSSQDDGHTISLHTPHVLDHTWHDLASTTFLDVERLSDCQAVEASGTTSWTISKFYIDPSTPSMHDCHLIALHDDRQIAIFHYAPTSNLNATSWKLNQIQSTLALPRHALHQLQGAREVSMALCTSASSGQLQHGGETFYIDVPINHIETHHHDTGEVIHPTISLNDTPLPGLLPIVRSNSFAFVNPRMTIGDRLPHGLCTSPFLGHPAMMTPQRRLITSSWKGDTLVIRSINPPLAALPEYRAIHNTPSTRTSVLDSRLFRDLSPCGQMEVVSMKSAPTDSTCILPVQNPYRHLTLMAIVTRRFKLANSSKYEYTCLTGTEMMQYQSYTSQLKTEPKLCGTGEVATRRRLVPTHIRLLALDASSQIETVMDVEINFNGSYQGEGCPTIAIYDPRSFKTKAALQRLRDGSLFSSTPILLVYTGTELVSFPLDRDHVEMLSDTSNRPHSLSSSHGTSPYLVLLIIAIGALGSVLAYKLGQSQGRSFSDGQSPQSEDKTRVQARSPIQSTQNRQDREPLPRSTEDRGPLSNLFTARSLARREVRRSNTTPKQYRGQSLSMDKSFPISNQIFEAPLRIPLLSEENDNDNCGCEERAVCQSCCDHLPPLQPVPDGVVFDERMLYLPPDQQPDFGLNRVSSPSNDYRSQTPKKQSTNKNNSPMTRTNINFFSSQRRGSPRTSTVKENDKRPSSSTEPQSGSSPMRLPTNFPERADQSTLNSALESLRYIAGLVDGNQPYSSSDEEASDELDILPRDNERLESENNIGEDNQQTRDESDLMALD